MDVVWGNATDVASVGARRGAEVLASDPDLRMTLVTCARLDIRESAQNEPGMSPHRRRPPHSLNQRSQDKLPLPDSRVRALQPPHSILILGVPGRPMSHHLIPVQHQIEIEHPGAVSESLCAADEAFGAFEQTQEVERCERGADLKASVSDISYLMMTEACIGWQAIGR